MTVAQQTEQPCTGGWEVTYVGEKGTGGTHPHPGTHHAHPLVTEGRWAMQICCIWAEPNTSDPSLVGYKLPRASLEGVHSPGQAWGGGSQQEDVKGCPLV